MTKLPLSFSITFFFSALSPSSLQTHSTPIRHRDSGLLFDASSVAHARNWRFPSIQHSLDREPNHVSSFILLAPCSPCVLNGDFPSKPMSLYATISDGSNWATNGGKYRVNYKYAPYDAEEEFFDFILCVVDQIHQSPKYDSNDVDALQLTTLATITKEQRTEMRNFRKNYMTYSYCHDCTRYLKSLPRVCD